MFEIIKSDLAARIGTLHTNHGKVQTPAFVPVIHPVKQTIPPKILKEMGFDLVITNAYITRNSYGNEAIKRGIHDIINYDSSIMTDSGGYQVLEYGDVDVSYTEMAKFETGIKTDIAIPLDKPTGYGLSKKDAQKYVKHTLHVSKETLDNSKDNGQIWVGPIQGGEHFDLVKKSTKSLVEYGFKMLALGSPVEFMESYQYKLLAQMIMAAKKNMPLSIPLHLFGAGHPLTIPFAVALGCDTFDSASYMLYAKQNRYITEDRTRHLSEIKHFSCSCKVCTKFSPSELNSLKDNDRINNIALHNLYSIKSEVDRVKEAIHEGRLWEYVIKKSRAHPKLFEVNEIFYQNSDYFMKTTPKFKHKAIFLYSKEDQYRPEIISFHGITRKFKSKKTKLVIIKDTNLKPAYLSPEFKRIEQKFKDIAQYCVWNPYLGLIPIEITDIYPAAHYVMSNVTLDPKDFPIFAETWKIILEKNNFAEIYFDKKDPFLKFFAKTIPTGITKRSI